MIKTYIPREKYLKRIEPFINKDIVKVIVGQRRVGKSYLLYQIMDEIKKKNSDAVIIYINKELYQFESIQNHKDLLKYVNNKLDLKKKNYLFIDEVQEIAEFEKAVRHFLASGSCDIYITGSNADLLSGELSTHLSGRFIEVIVHSLSYGEFLLFHKLPSGADALQKYIKYGGLPYLINIALEDDIVYDYLRNIYNTIILNDVVARFKLRNVHLLNQLVEYVADNVGSLVSAKKISDFLKSQRIKLSPNAILNYLSYLTASFFVHKVSRSDIIGKKIFEVNDKYYFEDIGLRHCLVGFKQVDIGKALENIVFSHLRFLGYKVTVGQTEDREVDFVAEKDSGRVYVQVAYHINDSARAREFGNLLAIPDNYPKIVVSMDDMAQGDVRGVRHMHILDFLKKDIII